MFPLAQERCRDLEMRNEKANCFRRADVDSTSGIKTSSDEQNPTTALVAKKSGKKIASGQTVTLKVRNSDGTLSNQFSFTK